MQPSNISNGGMCFYCAKIVQQAAMLDSTVDTVEYKVQNWLT